MQTQYVAIGCNLLNFKACSLISKYSDQVLRFCMHTSSFYKTPNQNRTKFQPIFITSGVIKAVESSI